MISCFYLLLGKWINIARHKDIPLRGEIHKVRGELVGRKLGRRFFHHLLQLLKGRSPRVVREAQDGELNLRTHTNSFLTLEIKANVTQTTTQSYGFDGWTQTINSCGFPQIPVDLSKKWMHVFSFKNYLNAVTLLTSKCETSDLTKVFTEIQVVFILRFFKTTLAGVAIRVDGAVFSQQFRCYLFYLIALPLWFLNSRCRIWRCSLSGSSPGWSSPAEVKEMKQSQILHLKDYSSFKCKKQLAPEKLCKHY